MSHTKHHITTRQMFGKLRAGVRIDPDAWIEVRAAVNDLMDQIKRHEKETK